MGLLPPPDFPIFPMRSPDEDSYNRLMRSILLATLACAPAHAMRRVAPVATGPGAPSVAVTGAPLAPASLADGTLAPLPLAPAGDVSAVPAVPAVAAGQAAVPAAGAASISEALPSAAETVLSVPGTPRTPAANDRLRSLPPYIFVRLDRLAQEASALRDVINLGKGSPDLAAPEVAVEALIAAARNVKTHTYPRADGTPDFRAAAAEWYERRFGVAPDPDSEILPLLGAKEGLGHMMLASLAPGDGVLVPSPGYPAYANQVVVTGGRVVPMRLMEKDGFLPDFDRLEAEIEAAKKDGPVRLMLLNFPANPTGAVVPDLALLERALAFAERHDLLVFYDNAYSELGFDGYQAPTMLQVPGSERRVIEFHSVSKSYSMAGFRVGFAVGDAEANGTLAKIKGYLDYGVPTFIQAAAAAALREGGPYVERTRAVYQERRDAMVAALRAAGWEVAPPKGAMYLWAKLPAAAAAMSSLEFSERLIREQGVVISPGSAFGPDGEGWMRISLIQPVERLREAAARIGAFLASLGR